MANREAESNTYRGVGQAFSDTGRPSRFRCNFQARLLYMSRGVRGTQELIADVTEISRTQMVITTEFSFLLPECFSVVLGARQYGIGCAIIARTGDRLTCNILQPESSELVKYLAEVKSPRRTLDQIDHPLFPKALTRW